MLVARTSDMHAAARLVNSATGEGVSEWLEEILAGTNPVGARALTLDYARYAAAEASLGWLNARVTARAPPSLPCWWVRCFRSALCRRTEYRPSETPRAVQSG